MTERKVVYIPHAETVLRLDDGSFIDPEIADKWVMAGRKVTNIPYFFGQTDALKAILSHDIQTVVTNPYKYDDSINNDQYVEITGEVDLFGRLSTPDTIKLSGSSFAPNYWFDHESDAITVETSQLQAQAFISYRIADHMVQAAKNLDLRGAGLGRLR